MRIFSYTKPQKGFGKISSFQIRKHLKTNGVSCDVKTFAQIDSTNAYARKIAQKRCKVTLVVADSQTNGRGRYDRKFYSPPHTGIYMSILAKAQNLNIDTDLLTVLSCVAVCRVLENFFGITPKIKWVNDIFWNGKKICGILCEGGSFSNSKGLDYVVLGIGLNLCSPKGGFPEEISSVAGAVDCDSISRNKIIAEITKEIFNLCQTGDNGKIVSEYKSRSIVIGKDISFNLNGKELSGRCEDINQKGNLIVKLENGENVCIKSGEVSLGSDSFLK